MPDHLTPAVDELRFVATDGPVIGSLCTGLGGLDLGVASVVGGRIAWCADPDPHATAILTARLPGVCNLGDLRTVDFTTVEPIEVLTAGFPCQDISAAGRRAGIEKGSRSGLWRSILDAIRVLRPHLVVVENVAALRWRNGGLDRVLADLAETGYDAVWRCLPASDTGAAHRRERVFLCAIPQPAREAQDADPQARDGEPRPERPGATPCEGHQINLNDAVDPVIKPISLSPTPTSADPGSAAIQTVRNSGRPIPAGCVTLTDSARLLPTPTAINPNDGESTQQWLRRRERHRARKINSNGMGMPLSIAVRLLPTPTASDAKNCTHTTHTGGPSLPDCARALTTPMPNGTSCATTQIQQIGSGLPQTHAALLPTPTAHDGSSNGISAASRQGGPSLLDTLRLLPTPRATDGTKGCPAQRGSKGDLMLPSAVIAVTTPTPGSTSYGKGGE